MTLKYTVTGPTVRAFIKACSGVMPDPGRMEIDAVDGFTVCPKIVVLIAFEQVLVAPDDPEE